MSEKLITKSFERILDKGKHRGFITYEELGNIESALATRQEVYSGYLRLKGESHADTCLVADNYAKSLGELQRFEEAKSVLRKMMPVARRVLGESNELTLRMKWNYARTLSEIRANMRNPDPTPTGLVAMLDFNARTDGFGVVNTPVAGDGGYAVMTGGASNGVVDFQTLTSTRRERPRKGKSIQAEDSMIEPERQVHGSVF